MGFYTLFYKNEMELLWNAYYNADSNKIDKQILNIVQDKIDAMNDDSYVNMQKEDYYAITHALYTMHLQDERYQNIYLRFATNWITQKKLPNW